MRVIAGSAKGRRLSAPASKRVRPALDQVKEAIFNILFDVTGARVLDLFAGSGSIGIEALSRGARLAVFVEEWGPAVASMQKNLERCKFTDRARVMKSTVSRAIASLRREGQLFDLVFVDPPYLKNLVQPTLKKISSAGILANDGLIVTEHHPREEIGEVSGLLLTDSRKYGQIRVTFLRPSSSA